jgi:hypothetical protein
MDIFLLYLFTRVDNFIAAAAIVWILAGLFLFLCLIFSPIIIGEWEDEGKLHKAIVAAKKPLMWIFGICLFISLMIPTKKDMAIIVGGHLAIEAVQSDAAKKVYAIVTNLLDEEIATIAKRKSEK